MVFSALARYLKNLGDKADHWIEQVVMVAPRSPDAKYWWSIVVWLLLVAFYSHHYWDVGPFNFFLLPVVVACFVFRQKGLYVILVSALLWLGLGLLEGWPWDRIFESLGFALLEWSLIGFLITITLSKYAKLRGLQDNIQQDLELARRLQRSLTSKHMSLGFMEISGFIEQSRLVGGDFFYFRPFRKHYTVFCLGDVMGKGISASLVMAMVMGFVYEWGKKLTSPNSVLQRLNQRLLGFWGDNNEFFVTTFYAVFDEKSECLTYASAGHETALLLRRDGSIEELRSSGIPLGIMEDVVYKEQKVTLDKGDRVIVFTDGITEIRNREGEMWGLESLIPVLKSTLGLKNRDALEKIKQEARRYSEDRLLDDMALLVVDRVN